MSIKEIGEFSYGLKGAQFTEADKNHKIAENVRYC